MNGGPDNLVNGDDIVLVRKRNQQQQLFMRTYNEDDDLKNLRMGGSMMNRYGTFAIVFILM